MANNKSVPKISEQYKMQMQFFVKDKNGFIVKVPKAKFQKEAEKYIKMGYGGYFDISQKEALKRAKSHQVAEKKAAVKLAQDIEAAQKSVEEKNAALLKLDSEVKVLDGALTEAKDLVDEQQKTNAKLVQEKSKLTTTADNAKKAADKANSEKDALAKVVEDMKKQLADLKKK